jgi:isopenicillin-N N-acyltransferase-like protein
MNTRWALGIFATVLLLAVACVIQGLVAQHNAFTPPPLRLDLLADYAESAHLEPVGKGLWRVDGLAVVRAQGPPREMGRQYGRALAPQIKQAVQAYLLDKVVRQWGYPLDYQRRCAASMLRHIPAEYVEEMQGVAEGSGMDYQLILLLHTHADTVHYGKSWGRPGAAPGRSCSNFAVWGRWTTHGQLLHGRNLDWTTDTGVQQVACVYVGVPQQGLPFALVTYAGCIGAVTGMNAAAISFGEMTSSSAAETLDGLPLFFLCRKLLQYCRSIEQVEDLVTRDYRPTTGWNFVVTDAKVPTARVFEVDAQQVVMFKPSDPAENDPPLHWPLPECVRRTNHYVSRAMQQRQARRVKIPYAVGRLLLRSLDTWQRYAALSYWIKTHPHQLDARLARALLQTEPVAGKGNLHSVVFEPAARRMWVANASWHEGRAQPAWQQHYVYLDLTRFWPAR